MPFLRMRGVLEPRGAEWLAIWGFSPAASPAVLGAADTPVPEGTRMRLGAFRQGTREWPALFDEDWVRGIPGTWLVEVRSTPSWTDPPPPAPLNRAHSGYLLVLPPGQGPGKAAAGDGQPSPPAVNGSFPMQVLLRSRLGGANWHLSPVDRPHILVPATVDFGKGRQSPQVSRNGRYDVTCRLGAMQSVSPGGKDCRLWLFVAPAKAKAEAGDGPGAGPLPGAPRPAMNGAVDLAPDEENGRGPGAVGGREDPADGPGNEEEEEGPWGPER
jgi:hypothetical protein